MLDEKQAIKQIELISDIAAQMANDGHILAIFITMDPQDPSKTNIIVPPYIGRESIPESLEEIARQMKNTRPTAHLRNRTN